MDFSRLQRTEVVGVLAGLALVASLFIPWFTLTDTPERAAQNSWMCGTGDLSCTGFETFPLMRWLLLAAAAAPLILAWIVVRGHKLAWPPGEMTMIVGFAATVLVLYNGLIDKPATGDVEFGVSTEPGYYLALVASIAMAGAGAFRSLEHGGGAEKRPPGTF